MGLYGRETDKLALLLKGWSKHLVGLLEEDAPNRSMQLITIERQFERRAWIIRKMKENMGMANKKFENSSFKGFVNVSLSQQDKEAYVSWDVQDTDVWDGIAQYAEGGYKFSVSRNKQNDHFTASVTGTEDAGKNAGYSVTAFAPTPYEAVRVVLFKVSVVLPPVWADYKPSGADAIG